MAGKEATVFILDLGRSMGQKRHGRDQTDLDWALDYVWDKITTTVATGRKTALMSVVGCRTDETDLADVMDNDTVGYENITVFCPLKQFLLGDIRNLQKQLIIGNTNDGDLISALAVAIHMIDIATQNAKGAPLKYDRRVIIMTDGRGHFDTEDLSQIVSKVKDAAAPIEIVLLGVDFDDLDNGYKEENKDSQKAKNEGILSDFVQECQGNFGTLAVAIEQLQTPRLKETRPVPSFKGVLTLGDVEMYEATISIDVERYPCTMLATPPTASSFAVRTDLTGADSSTQSTATVKSDYHLMNDLSAVRNQRVYQVDDEGEPGTKKNVEPDELERGYEYGRTAVHIAESDMNVVKLETQASLQLVGFIKAEEFERYLPLSRANFIVPQKANQSAQLGLSSLIHALYETDCYAVARLVTKEMKPPILVLLLPRIELEWEALVDVELPFEEDMRRYKFPPLDRKMTVSGKTITEHRDLPTKSLMKAMSDYVDAMDLSKLGRDEDGNEEEYAKIEDTFAPLVHRINQIIRWRATHPDTTLELPRPQDILMKYSTPPAELLERTDSQLNALKQAAGVKQVPPKVKGRGRRQRSDRDKPLSGLDVDELLGDVKRVKIESNNLVPSFKQALAATDDLDAIKDAADGLAKEIRALIHNSIGDKGYGRALEAIRVMRDEITELEEPEIYNGFIRSLKGEILEGKLNGNRKDMWWKIKGGRCGLIDDQRCQFSGVTEEEAQKFYES